ncbi:2-oxo-4-hydroxy-4-carboxy-5-ureidoimidazoline decarboxylase [Pannus brasiliensis CCIBt3594]|uniref:2-oxo-4-hydroxy-4-carboxy-5-ureidoimidazoline decarboxylase n=1 Tax=Pannus brasiliensis CCIBt3594 TaxID=1427578 RepID=A0AAW9QTV5_9CHRO
MSYSIESLNQMDEAAFVSALGAIFEDTPEIARETWQYRPFTDVNSLYTRMIAIVNAFSLEEKLTLIRAHPDLGTRAKMADASVKEQAGVGLDRLTPEEFDRFQSLNQAYRDKFGFPFIIAVKNHTKESILDNFEERLSNEVGEEIDRAIAEIGKIAGFRLADTVSGS